MTSREVFRLEGFALRRLGVKPIVEPIQLVDDLHLALRPGECVAMTGPSGIGKTSVCLGTFGLARGPLEVRGNYWLDGVRQPAGTLPRTQRGGVGFVLQEPSENFSPDIRIIPQLFDASAEKRTSEFFALADSLTQELGFEGLAGLSARRPGQLSRGEVQRLALVAALLRHPRLLVVDEPTANLDAAHRQRWCRVVNRWRLETGMAVWVATHDPAVVSGLEARVVGWSPSPADCLAAVGDDLAGVPGLAPALLLTGPSGSGKTTLLAALASLASAGRRGTDHRCSMLFQEARTGLNPYHPVVDSLAEVIVRAESVDRARARHRALEELARLDLALELGDRKPAELSTGQAQRAALALALVSRPAVLFCDEPTSALGAVHRGFVMRRLRQARVDGTSLVVASHDEELVRSLLAAGDCREIALGDGNAVPTASGILSSFPGFFPPGSRR